MEGFDGRLAGGMKGKGCGRVVDLLGGEDARVSCFGQGAALSVVEGESTMSGGFSLNGWWDEV